MTKGGREDQGALEPRFIVPAGEQFVLVSMPLGVVRGCLPGFSLLLAAPSPTGTDEVLAAQEESAGPLDTNAKLVLNFIDNYIKKTRKEKQPAESPSRCCGFHSICFNFLLRSQLSGLHRVLSCSRGVLQHQLLGSSGGAGASSTLQPQLPH